MLCTQLDNRRWQEILANENDPRIAKAPHTKITTFAGLAFAVGKRQARAYIKKVSILPEVEAKGERRCIFIRDTVRCCKYNRGPLCVSHYDEISMYHNFFRAQTLRDEFKAFHNDPQRVQLAGEQAMLRTMLAQVLKKMGNGDVSLDLISNVVVMCDKIGMLTEKMSKINQVTPEQLELLLNRFTDLFVKYVPSDKLEEASAELAKIQIVKIESAQPYEPGLHIEAPTPIDVEGTIVELKSVARERALLAIAERMKEEGEFTDGE